MRPRGEVLSAHQLERPDLIILPNGIGRPSYPGEWVVSRQGKPIDVLPASEFGARYETIETGTRVDETTKGQLELILGPGTTASASTLVAAVKRLADIQIQGVSITFTVGQLEEIKVRADKNGRTFQEEVERVVERLSGDIFWSV